MTSRALMRFLAVDLALLAGLIGLLRYAPDFVNRIDAFVQSAVAPFQTLHGVETFLIITVLGGAVGVISVVVAFAYLARLSLEHVARLTFALVAVSFAEKVVKEVFLRARPDPLIWLDPLPSYSFPSAHAAASLTLYGFIAAVLYVRAKTRGQRMLAVAIPLVIAFFIGASRIVLSAHYFSDVLGGFLVGAAVLAVAFALPLSRLHLGKY